MLERLIALPWTLALRRDLEIEVTLLQGLMTVTLLESGFQIAYWETPVGQVFVETSKPNEPCEIVLGPNTSVRVSPRVAVKFAARWRVPIHRLAK